MCRIAGLVSERLPARQMSSMVKAMCDTMQHGGPDDEGVADNEQAQLSFGHRRLSIIDLSAKGHQPMADVQQKALVTFNGEIYNYRELKHTLQSLGAVFNTATDTEVILQAYLYWGTASFAKLRGMFAFALHDNAKGLTYLVRDTNGIKPLYYSAENGQLTFASEIRAFKAANITATEQRWPVWLLAYGHIPEPFTTLKNVLSLPKGHFLQWDKNGSHSLNNYNTPPTQSAYITDIKTAHEGLYSHFENAIKRQLIADAPIGVFLSGGIDSSVITLLADAQNEHQLKTVSIFFDEKEYDERTYQQAVLNKINAVNITHLVKKQDLDEHLPQILAAMDMPTTDGINSWFISKYAHEDGLKAVLSGVGADELFGGYPSFSRIKYLKYLRKLPASVLNKVGHMAKDSYKRLTYLVNEHPAADYLFLRGLYSPSEISQIAGISERELSEILFSSNTVTPTGNYDELHASWFETNMYMQNQLLRDTDVMGMCHSLEVRVPFLDEDFKQFAQQIHPGLRFDTARPKKILIDSFKPILPQEVWNRPKMGFTFPLQQWMKNNSLIANESHYKGPAAKTIIKQFKNGQTHWSRAFALYQVQQHV
jgi:asparagine synthase (glutamine-hydrolysing)